MGMDAIAIMSKLRCSKELAIRLVGLDLAMLGVGAGAGARAVPRKPEYVDLEMVYRTVMAKDDLDVNNADEVAALIYFELGLETTEDADLIVECALAGRILGGDRDIFQALYKKKPDGSYDIKGGIRCGMGGMNSRYSEYLLQDVIGLLSGGKYGNCHFSTNPYKYTYSAKLLEEAFKPVHGVNVKAIPEYGFVGFKSYDALYWYIKTHKPDLSKWLNIKSSDEPYCVMIAGKQYVGVKEKLSYGYGSYRRPEDPIYDGAIFAAFSGDVDLIEYFVEKTIDGTFVPERSGNVKRDLGYQGFSEKLLSYFGCSDVIDISKLSSLSPYRALTVLAVGDYETALEMLAIVHPDVDQAILMQYTFNRLYGGMLLEKHGFDVMAKMHAILNSGDIRCMELVYKLYGDSMNKLVEAWNLNENAIDFCREKEIVIDLADPADADESRDTNFTHPSYKYKINRRTFARMLSGESVAIKKYILDRFDDMAKTFGNNTEYYLYKLIAFSKASPELANVVGKQLKNVYGSKEALYASIIWSGDVDMVDCIVPLLDLKSYNVLSLESITKHYIYQDDAQSLFDPKPASANYHEGPIFRDCAGLISPPSKETYAKAILRTIEVKPEILAYSAEPIVKYCPPEYVDRIFDALRNTGRDYHSVLRGIKSDMSDSQFSKYMLTKGTWNSNSIEHMEFSEFVRFFKSIKGTASTLPQASFIKFMHYAIKKVDASAVNYILRHSGEGANAPIITSDLLAFAMYQSRSDKSGRDLNVTYAYSSEEEDNTPTYSPAIENSVDIFTVLITRAPHEETHKFYTKLVNYGLINDIIEHWDISEPA